MVAGRDRQQAARPQGAEVLPGDPTKATGVPPGYKRTEVGVIPVEWEVAPLRACLRRRPGYGINAAAVAFDDTLPTYLRITDISDDSRFRPSPRVSVKHSSAMEFFLSEGDLVLARTGASVGKSYLYDPRDGALVFAGFLICVSPDGVRLSSAFLSYCVQTKRYWDWVATASVRSGQPGINGREYGGWRVSLPPLPEQRAIAEALSDVDGLLGSLDRLLAKKRAIKQGAMQQLLTGRTRLPGFEGEWETKRLGEIAERVGSGITPTGGENVYVADGRPFIRSQNVGWGQLELGDMAFLTEDTHASFLSSEIEEGDVLLNITGASIGRSAVADLRVAGGNVNQHVCEIRVKPGELNPAFLSTYLLSTPGQKQIDSFQAGGNRQGLNYEQVRSFVIPLPPLSEQEAIAAVLSEMDAEIGALERRREKTRAIKQGMMQQLLTGRIRLVEQQAAPRAATKHNAQIDMAVVLSVLVKDFGSEEYPMGRLRRTKLAYLLERHAKGTSEGYLKKAAGPYRPETKYRGPESIAVKNGYVREHRSHNGTGFVAAGNIAQAEAYFEQWYGAEKRQWLQQFHYRSKDKLELLTTVDMAVQELRTAGQPVDVQRVRELIAAEPEWKPKLGRAIFSDDEIAQAIEESRRLFG